MILKQIDEAVSSGARLFKACGILGINEKSIQRWRLEEDGGEDRRHGPNSKPKNQLSSKEIDKIIEIATSPEYRNLPPSQIVPDLADKGKFFGSEATFYRVLEQKKLNAHRDASKPKKHKKPRQLIANGPNQVWTWDITFLKSPIKGVFYYLYLVVDVWSRKIVGFEIHESESSELAAFLFESICQKEGIRFGGLSVHSDNGSAMKGATLLVTFNYLGVTPSYSRPHVSNDNPYSESLFRTLKYRPEYPTKPFRSIEDAREWVSGFVDWYNNAHRHSSIRFVTPSQRHEMESSKILKLREEVYKKAKEKHPERWSRKTRSWKDINTVSLNPENPSRMITINRGSLKNAVGF